MKLFCLMLARRDCSGGRSAAACSAVYMLPMSGGLDQYLANRLTSDGTCSRWSPIPKLADAIFTDQLGAGFEQKLTDAVCRRRPKDDDKRRQDLRPHAFGIRTAARGPVFLVDVKSHAVIWSTYREARADHVAETMNRTASRIVEQIKKQQKSKNVGQHACSRLYDRRSIGPVAAMKSGRRQACRHNLRSRFSFTSSR